jgi:hypothetical protein
MKNIWFRWILFIIFKSIIELPFIISGPIILISMYLYFFNGPPEAIDKHIIVIWFVTLICSHIAMIDYFISITMPFKQYNFFNFPIWWESYNKDDFWRK